MRSRAAAGVAPGLACLLLAGCGSSQTQQVRSKVQQFAVAVAHRDARTICTEVFAPSLVKRFASTGVGCKRALDIFLAGLHHPTLAVGRVTVHGSRASAMTLSGASGQTASLRPIELVKTSAGWRVAALGTPVKSSSGSGAGSQTTSTKGASTTSTKGASTTSTKGGSTTPTNGAGG